jgi:hypothetical protein
MPPAHPTAAPTISPLHHTDSPRRPPHTAMLGHPDADPAVPEVHLIPTSPRSIEACFRLGIDPIELQYKPAKHFQRPGESGELADMRYSHHETLRQVRGRGVEAQRACRLQRCWHCCHTSARIPPPWR